jgi:hypothetical protein
VILVLSVFIILTIDSSRFCLFSYFACCSAFAHPSQKGFLEGKHYTDHIVDLNKFFYEGVVKKIQRFIFSMDTAKAFDSIDHDYIF